MTIQVIKGQKVDVTKNRPDIKNVVVNINWQVKDRRKASLYEIDSAASILTMNGKTRDALDNIDQISDEQVDERLLNEFPLWLAKAKLKNIMDKVFVYGTLMKGHGNHRYHLLK